MFTTGFSCVLVFNNNNLSKDTTVGNLRQAYNSRPTISRIILNLFCNNLRFLAVIFYCSTTFSFVLLFVGFSKGCVKLTCKCKFPAIKCATLYYVMRISLKQQSDYKCFSATFNYTEVSALNLFTIRATTSHFMILFKSTRKVNWKFLNIMSPFLRVANNMFVREFARNHDIDQNLQSILHT